MVGFLEMAVREALFTHLDQVAPDGRLSWEQTASFEFAGETYAIRQTRGRGIHKPRQLSAALSITTKFTPFGQQPPYDDSIGVEGFPRYKYERTDPQLSTNRALRAAKDLELPIVYFLGIRPGIYQANYPMYVIDEDSANMEFTLGFSRGDLSLDLSSLSAPEKVYAARMTRQRLHQPVFREQVLHAYQCRCTVCRLGHSQLLDAAHITSDSEVGGDPVITNGLALCKIHHAAYDQNIMGITPDYEIKISESLLDEIDGPMLRHGLQEMHGSKIALPKHRLQHPDQDRLALRFESFRAAS
ncbi:MAG TPA: HNH endonuclease [Acidimicrobiales bacterium]